jgi:MOSC domain-containing protein YiiM
MFEAISSADDGSNPVPSWLGIVTHLHICPRAFSPMQEVAQANLVAGKGIVGDRYMIGNELGFHSHKREDGRQITLFAIEALEAVKRDFGIDFAPHEHRRNVTVLGVPLNHLVGRTFQLGSTLVQATRLSSPCRHIEEVTNKPVFAAMVNRAGLHCRILDGGTLRVGDAVCSV